MPWFHCEKWLCKYQYFYPKMFIVWLILVRTWLFWIILCWLLENRVPMVKLEQLWKNNHKDYLQKSLWYLFAVKTFFNKILVKNGRMTFIIFCFGGFQRKWRIFIKKNNLWPSNKALSADLFLLTQHVCVSCLLFGLVKSVTYTDRFFSHSKMKR